MNSHDSCMKSWSVSVENLSYLMSSYKVWVEKCATFRTFICTKKISTLSGVIVFASSICSCHIYMCPIRNIDRFWVLDFFWPSSGIEPNLCWAQCPTFLNAQHFYLDIRLVMYDKTGRIIERSKLEERGYSQYSIIDRKGDTHEEL